MAEIITYPTTQARAIGNIFELLQNAVTQLQQMLDHFRDAPPLGLRMFVELRGVEGTKHAGQSLAQVDGLGAELRVKVTLDHLHESAQVWECPTPSIGICRPFT